MTHRRLILTALGWAVYALIRPLAANAQATFLVQLDTSPLVGSASGPFSIDLQLIDASGAGDANNSALATAFQFGSGGSAGGNPTLLGGVTGDLSSGVSMIDSSPFNEFTETFVPGNALRFQLDLTTNQDPGGISDQFAFAILDGNGDPLPTQGPGNALLTVDMGSAFAQAFGAPPGAAIALAAPSVQAVPESAPGVVLVAAIIGMASLLRGRTLLARRPYGTAANGMQSPWVYRANG